MTLEEPAPGDDDSSTSHRSHQEQHGDRAPDEAPMWRHLTEAVHPAVYGRSWVPWLRLVLLLAVLAVIVVGGR